MQFPPEFKNLLREFHQDFFLDVAPEDAIISALISIGRTQCEAVKQFLDRLLSTTFDVHEFKDLWAASSAEIGLVNPEQFPAFLELIRSLIDSPRVRSSPVP